MFQIFDAVENHFSHCSSQLLCSRLLLSLQVKFCMHHIFFKSNFFRIGFHQSDSGGFLKNKIKRENFHDLLENLSFLDLSTRFDNYLSHQSHQVPDFSSTRSKEKHKTEERDRQILPMPRIG